MSRPLLVMVATLAAACVPVACGGDDAPGLAGSWLSDRDATVRAFEEWIPAAARERLAVETSRGGELRVALDLRDDGSFELEMKLPVVGVVESGRWSRDGDRVTLEVTHRNGTPVEAPRRHELEAAGGNLRFGGEDQPAFVLTRSAD